MSSPEQQSHRKEIIERGIRDQVREYRVLLELCHSGGASELLDTVSVDNFQLEGRMNMNRETAHIVLVEAGYTPEEADAYLIAIPRRTVDSKVYVDSEKWNTDAIYKGYKQREFAEASAKLRSEVQ